MAYSGIELDVFRDVPGFRGILKAVLKCQIQLLVKQLSEQADEESVFLCANVSRGTLSFLGSESARGFIQENDEMKKQFLGYCMKARQKKSELSTSFLPQHATPASDVVIRSPENSVGFAVHRKPYYRIQKRNTRLRSAGKKYSHILPKPLNADNSLLNHRGSRKAQEDSQVLSEIHKPFRADQNQNVAVKSECQSDNDSENSRHSLMQKQELTEDETSQQEVIVKVEPLDDMEETGDMKTTEMSEEIQSFSDGLVSEQSSRIVMETDEPQQDENQSFEYVLDKDNSAEIITPWKPEENRTNHISSKRKQTLPIRIKQKAEAWNQNKDTCKRGNHSANGSVLFSPQEGEHGRQSLVQKSHDYSYSNSPASQRPAVDYIYPYVYGENEKTGTSRMTLQNIGGQREVDPSGQSVYVPSISAFPGTQNSLHEQSLSPSVDNRLDNSLPYDNRGIDELTPSMNWTEESVAAMTPKSGMKTYTKTPLIDGLFVTRGEGRYEKLIKCEECGKVCRTSNMARHKKRYCTAVPKEIRRQQVRQKDWSFTEEMENFGKSFDTSYGDDKGHDSTVKQEINILGDTMQLDPTDSVKKRGLKAEKGGNSSPGNSSTDDSSVYQDSGTKQESVCVKQEPS